MRYSFQLGHRLHHVTLEEHADGPRFVVDGNAYAPQVQAVGKGHYRVALNGKSYEFRVHNGRVMEGAHQLDLEVRRARPELSRARAGARRADGRIKPPMPGKVVEVKVKEGQAVAAGDVLLILEAMKMQNDLKSPLSGTVSRIHVSDGTNVEATTVLLEIEPSTGGA